MKLYQAVDKLDGTDTFFLVYADGSVATMPVCELWIVKDNVDYYARESAKRFKDVINPVLIAEW